MVQSLTSWEPQRLMFRACVSPWRYFFFEGSTNAGGWRLEPPRKRWLCVFSDVAEDSQVESPSFEQKNGFTHRKSPPLSLSKRVVDLTKYQAFFHRGMCSGKIDVHAGSLASQVDNTVVSGMKRTTTGEEQPLMYYVAVKTINEILSRPGWEKVLEERNIQFTSLLVTEVVRRQANAHTALAFFEWVKQQQGFEHTARTYKAMLQKLMLNRGAKPRNGDTFVQVMNESLEKGWSPGVTIHTFLIDGYCKTGKMDAAFEHFRSMSTHGCTPNVVTYSSLIGGLIKAERMDEAIKLLDEMEAKNCQPNVVTYSVLIHGLVKCKQLLGACLIFERMKKACCSPNLITYSTLIDGGARAGKFEMVSNIFNEMREAKCVPNLFIYGTLINYFVKVGKLQQAWDLFTEMKQHGLEPNLFIFTPLMTSLGKAGDWPRAQELLAEMKTSNCVPDVVAYSALVAGLVSAGKWEEACLVVDDMERNGCRPNEITYTVIIDGLVKARQGQRAHALFQKMVRKGITATMYTEESLLQVLNRKRAI